MKRAGNGLFFMARLKGAAGGSKRQS